MSRRPQHKKRDTLNRAAQVFPPGGALMYVPPNVAQTIYGQTFYGSQTKNTPVGQTTLFSPGQPLPPQQGADPLGKPVQFRFPVSVNTYPVDRSLGQPDIPSFEQLRRLAKMYSGITLNERYWLDMVPRMTLDIKLKKVFSDAGAEAKNYQKEINFFRNFWEKPDGKQDMHSWLRKALREQTQIDELYLYKNRTRGGKLMGLWIVAGDQMKPLLDDWGMTPDAPAYAYQQYPWGIPGCMYSTDQMYHYQESPAADSPYGFSRVERFILEVNQALRKKKKDLANFTEGNIPQSFMEVPESLNWTPDQIDSYSQSFNALVAGQAQQQVRMLFLQPGMKYVTAEQYQMLSDFDLFLFKLACGTYGVPVTEFGFTEDSNRSSGESQEDMVYRRTIGPNAIVYGGVFTQSMATDFPPEMHGEMFEAVFGGYEELEDENEKAEANTTYTGAGVLGLTDAAKLGNLPIDPEAPVIGRVLMTPNGPIFLDDEEFMAAWKSAQMAGFKLASNPPPAPANNAPGDSLDSANAAPKSSAKSDSEVPEGDEKPVMSRVVEALAGLEEQLRVLRARNITPQEDDFEQGTQPRTENEARGSQHTGRAVEHATRAGAQREDQRTQPEGTDRANELHQEYRRWKERAIADVKAGRSQRPFQSALISTATQRSIASGLEVCATPEDVRHLFELIRATDPEPERDASFLAEAASASSNGGSQGQSRSGWKLRW